MQVTVEKKQYFSVQIPRKKLQVYLQSDHSSSSDCCPLLLSAHIVLIKKIT